MNQKLKNLDRVTCSTNKLCRGKVYTVNFFRGGQFLKLYQVNTNVVFDLNGNCIEAPAKTRDSFTPFRVGDKLDFYKSNTYYVEQQKHRLQETVINYG